MATYQVYSEINTVKLPSDVTLQSWTELTMGEDMASA